MDTLIKQQRENIVNNYIDAYNAGDTEKLSSLLTQNATFENIAVDRILRGKVTIKDQLDSSMDFFKSRIIEIKSFRHSADYAEIDVLSSSIFAVSVGKHGKGDKHTTNGKMVFKFEEPLIKEIISYPEDVVFFNAMI